MLTSTSRPLRVAVLCSGRAPGLLHLLNTDPRRGTDYDVVCCVTSDDTFAEEVRVERRGIPCLSHPIARCCAERGVRRRNLDARQEYESIELAGLAFVEPRSPLDLARVGRWALQPDGSFTPDESLMGVIS